MGFAYGQTVIRERRTTKPSPANPSRPIPVDWAVGPLETLEIEDAYVASSSSTRSSSATRSQILTDKSLFVEDPEADVLPGDRIRYGSSIGYVHVVPEADVNPFTGWQPVKEIPLEEASG